MSARKCRYLFIFNYTKTKTRAKNEIEKSFVILIYRNYKILKDIKENKGIKENILIICRLSYILV